MNIAFKVRANVFDICQANRGDESGGKVFLKRLLGEAFELVYSFFDEFRIHLGDVQKQGKF